MRAVEKAVIPAAGRGTRMHPVSRVVPKELLPLGTFPLIHFTVLEAIEGGMTEIAVVVNSEKELIRRYLTELQREGEFSEVRFRFVEQPRPDGLADALDRCRDFAGGEPFAVLLPDNVFPGGDHSLRGLVETYLKKGRDVVGVLELNSLQARGYGDAGRFDCREEEDGLLEITRLYDKGEGTVRLSEKATTLRTCGRYVCHTHLFEYIDLVRPRIEGEFDEVPVYQRIVSEKGAVGFLLSGPVFDVGNPQGYLAACAHLFEHPRSL